MNKKKMGLRIGEVTHVINCGKKITQELFGPIGKWSGGRRKNSVENIRKGIKKLDKTMKSNENTIRKKSIGMKSFAPIGVDEGLRS
jgi:hypothetical protein